MQEKEPHASEPRSPGHPQAHAAPGHSIPNAAVRCRTDLDGLRGYDAVHLASALSLTEPVVFASADAALCQAAQIEGLPLLANQAERGGP